MEKLKIVIVWGIQLHVIKKQVEEFERMYLGLYINDLRYKSGKKAKQKFINEIKPRISELNLNIRSFNHYIKLIHNDIVGIEKLPVVDFRLIKKIVDSHKDFPKESDGLEPVAEIIGEGNSASAVARKHTALKYKKCAHTVKN